MGHVTSSEHSDPLLLRYFLGLQKQIARNNIKSFYVIFHLPSRLCLEQLVYLKGLLFGLSSTDHQMCSSVKLCFAWVKKLVVTLCGASEGLDSINISRVSLSAASQLPQINWDLK